MAVNHVSWRDLHESLSELRIASALHYRLRSPLYGHRHRHVDQFDLSLVLDGVGRAVIAGARLDVQPGCVLLVRPRQWHESVGDQRVEFELIEVKFRAPTRRGMLAVPELPTMIRLAQPERLASSLDRLVAAHLADPSEDHWLPRTRLAEALQLMHAEAEHAGTAGDASRRDGIRAGVEQRIRQAAERIAVEHHQPLRVDQLAEQACLSRSRFAHHFRAIMGVTPIELAIRTRLHHARQLLAYSTLSAKEIATVCGFSSPQYFCRLFADREGCSPTAYRRRHQAGLEDRAG